MSVDKPPRISPSDLVEIPDGTICLVVEVWDRFSTGLLIGVMLNDEIKVFDASSVKKIKP